MGGHEKSDDRARRMASEALRALGLELRQARLNYDLSQAEAAQAAGISASTWSRLELGEALGVPLVTLAAAAAVVGLDLSLRAYPGGRVHRTAGHARLLRAPAGSPRSWRGMADGGATPEPR